MRRDVHEKPKGSTVLRGGGLNSPSNQDRDRDACRHASLNAALEPLSLAISQEKDMNVIKIGKEKVKIPLFIGDIKLI